MHYDGIVIGGGPAGISAALTLRRRNKTVALLRGELEDIPLYKARQVDNYPGCPRVSGRELLETMDLQARREGVEVIPGRVTAVMPMEPGFGVAAGQAYYQCGALVLCTGAAPAGAFPGERELLGRGVSYCVTCDGMLYRGKDVCLVGFTGQAGEEARLLESMGCRVKVFTQQGKKYAVEGDGRVEALTVGGERYPCQGVFILRPATMPDALIQGLAMDGAHVAVGRDMSTSIPGLFAAGDCAGKPYQAAKAAGEGNVAGISAARYLEAIEKGGEGA